MRDKYFDSEGWKRCTLRHYMDHGQGLWLVCGTCQKSRDFDIPEWSSKYSVDLDTPLMLLGKAIRCQRCGTRGGERGVSARATPYNNLPPQPRHHIDPICPRCGSDDVQKRRMQVTDYPGVTIWTRDKLPRFVTGKSMFVCGCYGCDNWWTQPEGIRLTG